MKQTITISPAPDPLSVVALSEQLAAVEVIVDPIDIYTKTNTITLLYVSDNIDKDIEKLIIKVVKAHSPEPPETEQDIIKRLSKDLILGQDPHAYGTLKGFELMHAGSVETREVINMLVVQLVASGLKLDIPVLINHTWEEAKLFWDSQL